MPKFFGQIEVEPYWNVNVQITIQYKSDKNIEVEPYWNVNEYGEVAKAVHGTLKQNHIGM